MDCRKIADWLPAYLDDALPARRAHAVAGHLAACPRCRREQQTLETATRALDRVGSRAPTIDLWASFSERLAAEPKERRVTPGRAALLWRPLGGLAAAAVAAAACCFVLVSTPVAPSLDGERASAKAAASATIAKPDSDLPPALTGAPRTMVALPKLVSPEATLPVRTATKAAKQTAPVPAPATALQPVPILPPAVIARAEDTGPSSLPIGDLTLAAEALMDAPQDAARAQVASEVIVLAEEMVRINRLLEDRTEGSS